MEPEVEETGPGTRGLSGVSEEEEEVAATAMEGGEVAATAMEGEEVAATALETASGTVTGKGTGAAMEMAIES